MAETESFAVACAAAEHSSPTAAGRGEAKRTLLLGAARVGVGGSAADVRLEMRSRVTDRCFLLPPSPRTAGSGEERMEESGEIRKRKVEYVRDRAPIAT